MHLSNSGKEIKLNLEYTLLVNKLLDHCHKLTKYLS